MTHPSESDVRPATILVDVQLQKTPADEHGASLPELRQLIETLGWDIVGTLTQKLRSRTAASLIGPGKLDELSDLVKAPRKADSVVFDHELTPTQRCDVIGLPCKLRTRRCRWASFDSFQSRARLLKRLAGSAEPELVARIRRHSLAAMRVQRFARRKSALDHPRFPS